jgi:hypothetical protein
MEGVEASRYSRTAPERRNATKTRTARSSLTYFHTKTTVLSATIFPMADEKNSFMA